jgi:hypothetical protein
MLQTIQTIKEQQSQQSKTTKAKAIQEALAAASSTARAVELYEEAVRATQFQGVSKENAQFRQWKEKEGDALKEKEVQTALRLYFNWLALTLQRANGASNKDLLPAVMSHAREVVADQAAMDAFDDAVKKEKDAAAAAPPGVRRPASVRDREKRADADAAKRMHDQIALRPLASSAFVQWMRLGEVISDIAPPRKNQKQGQGKAAAEAANPETSWEGTPANIDGIFTLIIQPELRNLKDPHVVDYWDAKLRHESEVATRSKLTFEVDKFNQVRRPQLLWSRSQDLAAIGHKNRAAAEMFSLIKGFPTHPDVPTWIEQLQALLVPPAAEPASISTAPTPTP